MITPDKCTSTSCFPPNKHCAKCSHAIFYGEVKFDSKTYKFSFSPVFGIDFIDRNGEPVAISSHISDSDIVWSQFSMWYNDKFKNGKITNQSSNKILITGSEISFNLEVEECDIKTKAMHIWNHPSKYSDYNDGSEKAYYSFLKFLWIKYPDGKEIQLARFVNNGE